MIFFVIALVSLSSWCVGRLMMIYATKAPVERLKDALLSFALAKTCEKNMSKDMFYEKYDGTKLPMISGTSLTNACFTYIVDINEVKNSPIYTESKLNAIYKYINKNLNTDDKVVVFFENFITNYKSTSCEKSS